MESKEFFEKLKTLVEAYGIHEYCLYGRFPQTINADGVLCPPNRVIFLDGELLVAAEAEYHLGRIAERKQP